MQITRRARGNVGQRPTSAKTDVGMPKIYIPKKKKKAEEEGEELVQGGENILAQIAASGQSSEDMLKMSGIYYISGEIKDDTLKPIHQDILLKHYVGPKHWNSDIQLIVNSPGGNLDETNALLDLLSNVRMDIRTICLGSCASAAAMLIASGTKGKRVMGPHSTIMIHRYTWGAYDKQQELVARRSIEDATHEQMIDFWIRHSKYKTKKDVEKHLLKTVDNWMTASQAVSHGIVDHIAAKIR